MSSTILNMREMVRGHCARLRFTFRHNTCCVQHLESVAEHAYFVGLYALLIAHSVNERFMMKDPSVAAEIDVAAVLERAILHDLEEARSGDFPRGFKYSDPELKAQLDIAAGKALDQVLAPLTGSPMMRAAWHALWRDAKCDTPEGCIVAFADFLSVLSFFAFEERGGNWSVLEHCNLMVQYFEEFRHPRFDFIRGLVEQVDPLMKEFFHDPRGPDGSCGHPGGAGPAVRRLRDQS